MLYDRDQSGCARFGLRWPVTLVLLILNLAVFAAQSMVNSPARFPIYQNFALSLDGLKHGHAWQLITFQFLHLPLADGGIFHLLGNLFVIYVFGSRVEKAIGAKEFLKLYLLSGTLGGLLQMIGGMFNPGQFGLAVVGASAGAFGLIAAYATLFPRNSLHLFFLPVAIRADVLLMLAVGVTLAGLFLPSGHVAHCAHLGGILTGYLFVRQMAARARPIPVMAAIEGKTSLNNAVARDYSGNRPC
jgi:membrane associated rhomboid family serine protease